MTQEYVEELTEVENLTIICGRYGGVDERVSEELATGIVSLGDFVLSGGEIVAAAVADAVIRCLEGVVGNEASLLGESFSEEGFAGPPQYTRPAEWDGVRVPGVLLSGNHAEIRAWRERAARVRAEERAAEGGPLHDFEPESSREENAMITSENLQQNITEFPAGRHGARAIPGHRGQPGTRPELRGSVHRPQGKRYQRDVRGYARPRSGWPWSGCSRCTRRRSPR